MSSSDNLPAVPDTVETSRVFGPMEFPDQGSLAKFFPEGYDLNLLDIKALESLKRFAKKENIVEDIATSGARTCNGPSCYLVKDTARKNDPSLERDLTRCSCPLYMIGKEPIGHPCPLDKIAAVRQGQMVCESLGVKSLTAAEEMIVGELVNFLTIQSRVFREIANLDSLVVEQTTDGAVFTKELKPTPLMELLDRIQKMISSKRKELLATPQIKHSAKIEAMEASVKVVTASEKLREFAERRKIMSGVTSKEDRTKIFTEALDIEPEELTDRDPKMQAMKEAELHNIDDSAIRDAIISSLDDDEDDD